LATVSIEAEIRNTFKSALTNVKAGNWDYMTVDQDFELHIATRHPLRMNAVLVYYYDSKTDEDEDNVGNSFTVEVVYMYFLGVRSFLLTFIPSITVVNQRSSMNSKQIKWTKI
jgi:hypothetical protein